MYSDLDNALFGETRMAAQRSSKAAKHVRFDDALNTCYDITPYSEIYGFVPSTMVATHTTAGNAYQLELVI